MAASIGFFEVRILIFGLLYNFLNLYPILIWFTTGYMFYCRLYALKIFVLTVPKLHFFCGSLVLFMSCVCHAFVSVHWCLVVTCWERAGLLALVCDV